MGSVTKSQSLQSYDNEPFIFRRWMLGNLEGKILTLIETLGFEAKREEAVKSIFRQSMWEWFRDNVFTIPDSKKEEYEEFINSCYTVPQQTVRPDIPSSPKI